MGTGIAKVALAVNPNELCEKVRNYYYYFAFVFVF